MTLYHGTTSALGMIIRREGLRIDVPDHYRNRFTVQVYIYLTEDFDLAHQFAAASVTAVGLGRPVVFSVESDSLPGSLTPDHGRGMKQSWRHRGDIPSNLLMVVDLARQIDENSNDTGR